MNLARCRAENENVGVFFHLIHALGSNSAFETREDEW